MFYPSLAGIAVREFQSNLSETSAQDARWEAQHASTAVSLLQNDVERLLMVTEALWTILKQQQGLQDNDLIKIVAEIDLRDGRLDNRVAPTPPRPCPHCGHTLAKKRPFCIFCGKPVATSPFER